MFTTTGFDRGAAGASCHLTPVSGARYGRTLPPFVVYPLPTGFNTGGHFCSWVLKC